MLVWYKTDFSISLLNICSEMIDCAVLMKWHYTTNNCYRERGLSTLSQPTVFSYHWPPWCCQWCDLPLSDCVGNTAGYCRLFAHGNPITATLSGNQWNSAFGDWLWDFYFSIFRCLYCPSSSSFFFFFQPERTKWKGPLVSGMSEELCFFMEWLRNGNQCTCHGWFWSPHVSPV